MVINFANLVTLIEGDYLDYLNESSIITKISKVKEEAGGWSQCHSHRELNIVFC